MAARPRRTGLPEAVQRALRAAHRAVLAGADPLGAVTAAAEALAGDPWAVVTGAGPLARADWTVASDDRDVGGCVFPAGAPAPALGAGRRDTGGFDSPPDLARRAVAAALAAAGRPVRTGLDPCCGAGAMLVALAEAGVGQVAGGDVDPVAVAVARVAAPRARVDLADALDGGEPADVVVTNPPFVPPERQDKALRRALVARWPWLRGRFDLAVPVAHAAVERARQGGGVGLVLPAPLLVEPYGEPLRRRWLERHRLAALGAPERFPGAGVRVAVVALAVGGRGGDFPATDALALPGVPFDPALRAGDADLVARVRAASVPLGELATVDTGLVAHGPHGGKAVLRRDGPGPGIVPFADAEDFFAGRRGWLAYRPETMHRPKHPSLFERPKLVLQRLAGDRALRVAVDRDGVYVGHTCTVVVPHDDAVPLERLADLLRDPLLLGLLRIERGARLDLYPRDVAGVPVPRVWYRQPERDLADAWGITDEDAGRLRSRSVPDRRSLVG